MYLALEADLTNSLPNIFDMVNLLYKLIIYYKEVYKPIPIRNYIQSDNNEKNDKIFFTNHQYWKDRPIYDWYKKASYILQGIF